MAVATVVLALLLVPVLDWLGLPRPLQMAGLLLLVVASLAAVGVGAGRAPADVLVAGRSVPPLANGVGIAGDALSLAAILGIVGAVLAWGYDGLVHLYGIVAGVALAPLVVAGALRGSGAATLPELVGMRYGHGLPRTLAACILGIACLLIAAAQLVALGLLVERLVELPYLATVALAAALVPCVAAGGHGAVARTHPLLWGIAAAALLLTVAAIVMDKTGWPAGQLGYGGMLGEVIAQEQALVRRALADPRTLKPMATPFLTLDTINYLGILLALALGFAALPQTAGRAALATGPRAARRAFAWAVLLLVVTASTLPALAIISRFELVSLVAKGTRVDALPAWMLDLSRQGILKVCAAVALDIETAVAACRRIARHPGVLRLQDLTVDTQLLLAGLPRISGLGFAFSMLMAAGLAAAGLAALQGALVPAALSMARDLRPAAISGDPIASGKFPFILTAAALCSAVIAAWRPADPLTLLVWGAALVAAGVLPALVLGLRWRRINAAGAVAGMAAGGGLVLLYVLGTRFLAPEFHMLFGNLSDISPAAQRRFFELVQAAAAAEPGPARATARAALDEYAQRIVGWWGLKPAGAALIGVPAAILAALVVSLLTWRSPIMSASALVALHRPARPTPSDVPQHSDQR